VEDAHHHVFVAPVTPTSGKMVDVIYYFISLYIAIMS
jgi:hypothetical protein